MAHIEALGLTLASEKTGVAYLGVASEVGEVQPIKIILSTRGDRLQVHREFDELGSPLLRRWPVPGPLKNVFQARTKRQPFRYASRKGMQMTV